jgi:hypothetical protein
VTIVGICFHARNSKSCVASMEDRRIFFEAARSAGCPDRNARRPQKMTPHPSQIACTKVGLLAKPAATCAPVLAAPRPAVTITRRGPVTGSVSQGRSSCCTLLLYKIEGGHPRSCEMAPDLLSGRRDSNPRPLDPQSSALPSCATSRCRTRTGSAPVQRSADRLLVAHAPPYLTTPTAS